VGTVWIVRHAPTAWTGVRWSGRSDPPLTAAGETAARRIARALASHLDGPVVIVSSPAVRATSTARAIAESSGGRSPSSLLTIDEDLAEVDFGRADGLTYQEMEAAFPELARRVLDRREDLDWPGGESATLLRVRAARAWCRITGAATAGDVVAVSHCGLIARLLAIAIGSLDTVGHMEPATAVQLVRVDGGARWRRAAALDQDGAADPKSSR
jgi:ribonuclease H / adenosylcobalamin/alpha-ribazole phosphatase